MSRAVDHLVVAAATLDDGVAWCERTLGVTPGPGGRHALFGTHNRLLKIASDRHPDAYLEIIAIDPDAPPPQRPRWFGLDEPALQRRIAAGPALVHVVVRTATLDADRDALAAAGIDAGTAIAAGRETPDGRLAWRILVRDDGRIAADGALPTLIRWDSGHPAPRMPDAGVALRSLAIGGLPAPARSLLAIDGVALADDADAPRLRAVFATPTGTVELESR